MIVTPGLVAAVSLVIAWPVHPTPASAAVAVLFAIVSGFVYEWITKRGHL